MTEGRYAQLSVPELLRFDPAQIVLARTDMLFKRTAKIDRFPVDAASTAADLKAARTSVSDTELTQLR